MNSSGWELDDEDIPVLGIGQAGERLLHQSALITNNYSFGTRLDMRSPSNVIKAYELCSRYGFDGDQVAVAISWAFELYEYGIIDAEDTGGLELTWGNDLVVIALIRQIVEQQGFGKLLSLGTEEASKIIGKGSDYYLTTNKHQDNLDTQRVSKGWALGNNISLRGGKHLDGAPFELVPGDEDLAALGLPLTPGSTVLVGAAAAAPAQAHAPQGLSVRDTNPVLRRVYVEPTSRCNLKCTTCIRNTWDEGFSDLPWSVYESLIDNSLPRDEPSETGYRQIVWQCGGVSRFRDMGA